MVIKSGASIGFQCPACGRIQIQALSAFAFAGSERRQISCQHCKRPFASLTAEGKNSYTLAALCLDCYDTHSFQMERGQFWRRPLLEFSCPQTGDLLLAVGQPEKIQELLDETYYVDDASLEAEESFIRAEARTPAEARAISQFLAVVEHFKELGREGRIGCACGKPQIQLQMEENRLELVCVRCGRVRRLKLSNEKERMQALEIQHLTLI